MCNYNYTASMYIDVRGWKIFHTLQYCIERKVERVRLRTRTVCSVEKFLPPESRLNQRMVPYSF